MSGSIQQRIQDHVGRVCVVAGCKHPVRRIGKYCSIHDRHAHRHGGPLQQPVRVAQLKFYRTKVQAFLRANSTSPAIATVADKLHSIIADAAAIPVYSRPKRGDWRTKVRLELTRLYEGGECSQCHRSPLERHPHALDDAPHRRPPLDHLEQRWQLILPAHRRAVVHVQRPLSVHWPGLQEPAG